MSGTYYLYAVLLLTLQDRKLASSKCFGPTLQCILNNTKLGRCFGLTLQYIINDTKLGKYEGKDCSRDKKIEGSSRTLMFFTNIVLVVEESPGIASRFVELLGLADDPAVSEL
jgi:hypothetical protein